MLRVLTSRRALGAGLAGAVAVLGVLAGSMEQRQEEQLLDQVVTEAQVISQLLVGMELADGGERGRSVLTADGGAHLQSGVDHLAAGDRLVGFQLWTPRGGLLFSDAERPDPLSPAERALLDDVLAGRPQVEFEHDAGRAVPTATVLIQPTDLDGAPTGLVAEVLLPEHEISRELAAASRRLYAGAAVVLSLVVALAVATRGHLLRREHQARHDPLTGLGNRALLRQEGRRLGGERRGRGAGPVDALLLLDLDGFKEVNDTLGHAVGDQLLVEVARALRAAVRPSDVVTRLGGDEFAVLLRGLPDGQAGLRAARTLATALERPFAVDRVSLEVGVSIGVALRPEHGDDLDLLLRRADVAMYQAKRNGGGARVYDADHDPHDEAQLELLSQLRAAIEGGQLRVHHQPRVSLRGGRAVGFEALVRWAHPTRGLLPPSAFLPLAERTALMRPLTDWVLREAVGHCAAWRAEGWDVGVAVNIAPGTLLDPGLPARITDLLAESGMPGSALELEMTETAVMVEPERAAATLRRLAAVGVHAAIDDFGTGYTSLSQLRTLPVARLKIDRSFVTHLAEDARDEAVTRAVVQLGHDLGLTVVAEGVETVPVARRLLEMGCDEVQGWLVARPMEAAAVPGWLAARAQASSSPRAIESPEWPGSPSSGSTETSTSGYSPRSRPAGRVNVVVPSPATPTETRPLTEGSSSQTS